MVQKGGDQFRGRFETHRNCTKGLLLQRIFLGWVLLSCIWSFAFLYLSFHYATSKTWTFKLYLDGEGPRFSFFILFMYLIQYVSHSIFLSLSYLCFFLTESWSKVLSSASFGSQFGIRFFTHISFGYQCLLRLLW